MSVPASGLLPRINRREVSLDHGGPVHECIWSLLRVVLGARWCHKAGCFGGRVGG